MENDVYGNAEYSVLPCLESLARRVVFPGLVKNVPPESRDLFLSVDGLSKIERSPHYFSCQCTIL